MVINVQVIVTSVHRGVTHAPERSQNIFCVGIEQMFSVEFQLIVLFAHRTAQNGFPVVIIVLRDVVLHAIHCVDKLSLKI